MNKPLFAILKNETPDSHQVWVNACNKYDLEYDVIDLPRSDWFQIVTRRDYDCFLLCPPGRVTVNKIMYDERVFIIANELKKFTYPSYHELLIHENKKYLSYWLKAHNLNHIKTWIFYDQKEAFEFLNTCNYPIVAKLSLGASGKGVKFINSRSEAETYIKKAFSKGIKGQIGPSFRQGDVTKRAINWILHPSFALKKIRGYFLDFKEKQIGYLIFQENIEHDYEWRCVKIGDSYFAHKKIKSGDMCSGSKGIEYVHPPESILDFTKNVCDVGNFNSMAIDILESDNNEYLINELQTVFGHVQEYICEVDGKPGRFIIKEDKWVFEEGYFNSNLSYDLRLENALNLLHNK